MRLEKPLRKYLEENKGFTPNKGTEIILNIVASPRLLLKKKQIRIRICTNTQILYLIAEIKSGQVFHSFERLFIWTIFTVKALQNT